MDTDSIIEIKETYSGQRKTFRCDLLARSEGEAVVLYRLDRRVCLGGLTFEPGAFSIGYFWESRPYNVYHFLNIHGKTLTFYINISEHTRITAGHIFWRDLIVDVLLTPGGECRILDEDELPANIDPAQLQYIEKTCTHIRENAGPLQREWEARSAEWFPARKQRSGFVHYPTP